MAINNIGEKVFVKDLSGSKYSDGVRKKTSDAPKESSKTDTVSLSSDSRDMLVAREAVNAAELTPVADPAREEKVSKLRAMYLSDQYKVEPDKIAEKLIGTHLSEIV